MVTRVAVRFQPDGTLDGQRIMTILLHTGFEEIVDRRCRTPGVTMGGPAAIQGLRTARLRTSVRLLQNGVAIPLGNQLVYERQKTVWYRAYPRVPKCLWVQDGSV